MSDSPMPTIDMMGQSIDGSLPGSHMPSPAPGEGQTDPMPWLDHSLGTSTFPFTPMSSSYNNNHPVQPGMVKPTSQAQNKPLFTWASQTFGQSNPGPYRDYSQPTPSTASSLYYGQTPLTQESFLTAPSLTPLSGQASDNSYTGISPNFSYLANEVNGDGSNGGSTQRRPVPIRHSSTSSVGTVPRSAPYGHAIGAWPYSYSGPVPPPMQNNFTLSQPPFSTRRPPTEPLPMYPPEPYQTARRLHPSPGMRSGHSPFRSVHYPGSAGRGGHQRHASLGQEAKPPRFKPTQEQKAILIETYETNPNPDGPTRELLAKRLGSDIKPKTLQIWFQNRRSKSKTKEQSANLPKTSGLSGSGHRRSASREIDMHALKLLTRSEDPNMILLPITVLAFTSWRRISTPGSCTPDLGASIHLTPSLELHPSEQFMPHIHLYTVQAGTTFRLTVYIDQESMGPEAVYMSTNPNSDVGSVAVRLTVRPGKTHFSMWTGQTWSSAMDFTEGMASAGGHCELTGNREAMVPAFTQVAKVLSPYGPEPAVESIPSFPSGWKFPSTSNLNEPASASDSTTAAFVDELLDPAYFADETQPFSSGSSNMPSSTHSSTGTSHSRLNNSTGTNQMYDFTNEVMEEPLDFSSWAGMAFQPSASAIPPVHGHNHHTTLSMSESARSRSTSAGDSVNTPVLDTLGLTNIGAAIGGDVVASGPDGPMDFKWF